MKKVFKAFRTRVELMVDGDGDHFEACYLLKKSCQHSYQNLILPSSHMAFLSLNLPPHSA